MKKTKSHSWVYTLMLMFPLLFFGSCTDKLGKAPTLDIYTGYISIENLNDGNINLKSASKLMLDLNITPNVGSIPEDYTIVNFYTSAPEVFTVSVDGELEGRQDGEAMLQIVAETRYMGNKVESVFPVKVSGQVKVEEVIISEKLQNGILLKEEGKVYMYDHIKVLPVNALDTRLTFKSSNEDVARVSGDTLYAISGGVVTVTLTTIDGTNISQEFGVTVEAPIKTWYDDQRESWNIINSHAIFPDGKGSSGDPKELLDNDTKTFINMKKPGKDGSIGADEILSFTIDTNEGLLVNQIYFHHRLDNTMARLRLWGFDLEGSNDGVNFVSIQEGVRIPSADVDGVNTLEGVVLLDKAAKYKYLKFICNHYDTALGGSIQIAEIRLGYDEAEDPAALTE